ncbi:aquaporin [bacterium]|nr:aquaporin [bacterium]
MIKTLKQHWPEYLIEAWALGTFMISACIFGTLLGYPASPVVQSIKNPMYLRVMMGIAMGLTAIFIIYSPWGKRSGAHFNPALTLTFFRLGKIHPADAAFYVCAQFIGGLAGVLIAAFFIGKAISDPAVHYVATLPGMHGIAAAFAGEFIISFLMMTMVLNVTNSQKLAKYAGIFGGFLVATYIIIESPISGMSMNPARTLGSAIPAGEWSALWLYFAAPTLAMLAAAQFFIWSHRKAICAKWQHDNNQRCIFRCGYKKLQEDSITQKHPIAQVRI